MLGEVALLPQGLIILAGITGSGKSTTIASMLHYVNRRRRCHILTVEDPIEYLFKDDKSVINQREVGIDVKNWEIGFKHAVREDPDVILVGEMRDRDTFQAAVHAAETGHLVLVQFTPRVPLRRSVVSSTSSPPRITARSDNPFRSICGRSSLKNW